MECIKTNILLDNKETLIDVEKATHYAVCNIEIKELEYEVLKALVVLKRSEVFKKVKNTPYYEKDYLISMKKKKTRKTVKKAIEETAGEVVISNGRLVELYYTTCCSGATSNSEDVIDKKLNYIRKIYCDKCSKREGYRKITVSDCEEVAAKELSYKEESKNIFSDIKRDDSGRIKSLSILGEEFSGKEFLRKFNLKSSKVYFKEEIISLKTEGEGDGLGICIEGAQKLAKEGKTYKDIINYYYTSISLEVLGGESSNTLDGKVFLLDPGHGGDDKGNVGVNIVESEFVLLISNHLKRLLKEKKAKVHLTREKDDLVTLSDRANMANELKPDFFISLHLNAFLMPGVNGAEAHCYELDNEAFELSDFILNEIEKTVKIKKRKVNIGDYFILRESKVSSIILECFYLTGSKDASVINEKSYEDIALAIYKGICKYYDIN